MQEEQITLDSGRLITVTDHERFLAELDRDKRRWKVRRRISVTSFIFLIIISLFYLVFPFIMTVEHAKIASEFNGIMISLIGFFSAIVMTYLGAATYSDVVTKGDFKSEKTIGKKED